MATKTKAAPKKGAAKKPAAKKAPAKKPESKAVVVESVDVQAAQDGVTVAINGVEHRLTVGQFLDVRRQFNDQAAGLVH